MEWSWAPPSNICLCVCSWMTCVSPSMVGKPGWTSQRLRCSSRAPPASTARRWATHKSHDLGQSVIESCDGICVCFRWSCCTAWCSRLWSTSTTRTRSRRDSAHMLVWFPAAGSHIIFVLSRQTQQAGNRVSGGWWQSSEQSWCWQLGGGKKIKKKTRQLLLKVVLYLRANFQSHILSLIWFSAFMMLHSFKHTGDKVLWELDVRLKNKPHQGKEV